MCLTHSSCAVRDPLHRTTQVLYSQHYGNQHNFQEDNSLDIAVNFIIKIYSDLVFLLKERSSCDVVLSMRFKISKRIIERMSQSAWLVRTLQTGDFQSSAHILMKMTVSLLTWWSKFVTSILCSLVVPPTLEKREKQRVCERCRLSLMTFR